MAGARQALNKVFGMPERRSALRLRVVSVFMTVAVFGFIGIAYALLILGPQFGQWLVDWFGIGENFPAIWSALRLPLVITLLTAFLVLCYRYLPYRRLPFRYLLGGAIPAVGGWILAGTLFRMYLRNFGNYDEVYGSLTSVILLLIFLWVSSVLLLFGAEVAAFLAAVRRKVETDDAKA
jgi:membrane protein